MAKNKENDNRKRAEDKMHELRERNIVHCHQLKDIHVLHPGGIQVALDNMLKNPSQVRDMSQQQRSK